MHKNYFDIVMEHIEENVTAPTDEIKREITNLIGRHSRSFSEYFNLLTEYTLDYYIKQRRLHYAAHELCVSQEKSICEIALEYQFSDQSSFSRAIKAKYNVTPNEIRKKSLWFDEDRFRLADFAGTKSNSRVSQAFRNLEVGCCFSSEDAGIIEEIEHLTDEYHFSFDTSCLIADLADRLGIPICFFGACCVNALADYHSDPHHKEYGIPPEVEFAISLGINSDEEMDAMCNHFKCEYYELDETKVYLYRKMIAEQK